MDVKDKVVIVTGASYGIGEAAARLLAEKGAKVALVARSVDRLQKLSEDLPGSFVVEADMSDDKQAADMVEKVYSHYGRIDVLINNAGQGYDAPVEHTDVKTFRQIFDLDVIGPIAAMKSAIPIMRKQGRGLIMNISSGTALMYLPGMGAYSAAKRALSGLSLTAREELKDEGIIVNVMYPYITLTEFEKNTIKHDKTEEEADFSHLPHKPDTAEFVADKILEGIESEEAVVYAHDWMDFSKR